MGEFLVSRAGLGYLIVYGSQVFNMDLVMTTVLLLAIAAVVMYQGVLWLEKYSKNVWEWFNEKISLLLALALLLSLLRLRRRQAKKKSP
jgi:ABC-type nitrate/sulfonate/bicarbonate transport system permease component